MSAARLSFTSSNVQRWERLATSVLLLICFAASVQAKPEGRLPRVGFCSWAVPEADLASLSHPIPKTLADGLRERGWEPGRNVELVFRSALGRRGGMAECIDVLVGSAVDVAVLVGSGSVRLMRERTASIPIVTNDVAAGPKDSHSRPKDNVTGVTGTPGFAGHRPRCGDDQFVVVEQPADLGDLPRVLRHVGLPPRAGPCRERC